MADQCTYKTLYKKATYQFYQAVVRVKISVDDAHRVQVWLKRENDGESAREHWLPGGMENRKVLEKVQDG